MISILVVAPRTLDLTSLARRHPSVEILTAHDPEETLEKLARNRRIDGVLLLTGAETPSIATAILEESAAPPLLFVPAAQADQVAGVQTLPGREPEELLDQLIALMGP